MDLQSLILNLSHYWADAGCIVQQPYDLEAWNPSVSRAAVTRLRIDSDFIGNLSKKSSRVSAGFLLRTSAAQRRAFSWLPAIAFPF